MVRPRTPKQLRAWALDRCAAISAAIKRLPRAKRPTVLNLGPVKTFYDEVYPFSLFAMRRYGERDDVVCVPNIDTRRDFDAEVHAASRVVKVEITIAYPPGWHLRMAHLMEHNFVLFYGPLSVEGRGRGRRITPEMMVIDPPDAMAFYLRLVRKAAEDKATTPGRYGKDYELLVYVEDSWFEAERDGAPVSEFLEREMVTLPLCFDALHVVGRTDRLHKSVVIPDIVDPGGPKAK
jgi:hypothetical protein